MASHKQRPRKWGEIERLPSGRYRARYVHEGARFNAPVTFDAKIDAQAWLNSRQRAIADGNWEPETTSPRARSQSVAEYAEHWLATRVNREGQPIRPRTRAEYVRLLAGPLKDLAVTPIEKLTPATVRTWYSVELTKGTKTQTARAYGLLKAICKTAVVDGLLTRDPCQVRGGANATTGRRMEPPTSAELAKIVNAITPRFKAMVLLAAWGGLRYGELTELRRKDIIIVHDGHTVERIALSVTRAVTHVTGEGFIVGTPKSHAGVRVVDLPPHVFPDVVKHLKDHTGDFPESLLFPTSDGSTHLAESTFVKHWYPARAAAGREDLPFHGLRHYGATRYALTGATLKEIQERLGHSTVKAAMTYQHTAGREAELAKRMSDLA